MDISDSPSDIRKFMSDGGWSFPVMLAADDAAQEYGVRVIPALFVIDAEGRIVKRIFGSATAAELSALVDGLTR